MTYGLLLAGETGQLHGFLKKFAISVDRERLERTLPRVQELLKGQKRAKPGYSMQMLLQELDKVVDLRLAQEMEQLFSMHSSRNN
jgi:hypothetical protein